MRIAHPDTGGSAEAFAAVQAAWSALEAWSADGHDDEWADADWGVDPDAAPVGTPVATANEPADDAPAARDETPPVDDDQEPDPPHEDDAGPRPAVPPADPRRPVAPGAAALPPTGLTFPKPRIHRTGGAGLERTLWWVAALAAMGVGVTAAINRARVEPFAYGAAVFLALLALSCFGFQRPLRGVGYYPWAAGVVAICWLACTIVWDAGSGATVTLVVEAAGATAATALALAVRSWREAARDRPSHHDARFQHALRLRGLAVEWNLVREALRTPGATVERLVEREPHAGPSAWTTLDPLSGRTRTRHLDQVTTEGSWVVVDARSGEVLAAAPPGAPEAWQRLMRGR